MSKIFSKKQVSKEDEVIHNFINKLLENSDINNKCIPDKFERHLYFSLLKVFLGNIKEASKTFKLEFLNHKITINIEPIIENSY